MPTTAHAQLLAADLPVERRTCPHLRRATEGPPVRRVRTPAGDDAWLVSGYAQVRLLLHDERLGRSHAATSGRARYSGDPGFDQVMHTDHAAADTMHTQLRALLQPQFTARRMRAMQSRVHELVHQHVDLLLDAEPPVDLREVFAEPLVHRVLCYLLGVPDADYEEYATLMHRGDVPGISRVLAQLVAVQRDGSSDTLISRLGRGDITDEQIVQTLLLLALAGTGGTVKQMLCGIMLLAEQTDVRARVAADPALLPSTVEELLRLTGGAGLPRYARTDIEVAGATIGAGDLVLLDLTLANYDGEAFDDPTTLDPARSPNRHLTLSHGSSTCLGAPLVRVLLASMFGAVLSRVPQLAPAGPVGRRSGPLSGGLPADVKFTW